MRRRAYLYITREAAGRRQLLVFVHRVPLDPEAGIQVPGGTGLHQQFRAYLTSSEP